MTWLETTPTLGCLAMHKGSYGLNWQPGSFGGAGIFGNPGGLGDQSVCGVAVAIDGVVYGPSITPQTALGGPAPGTPLFDHQLTPVSASPVTGTGAQEDPYLWRTVAEAGSTGIRVERIDSYVEGQSSVDTQLTAINRTAAARDVRLAAFGSCGVGALTWAQNTGFLTFRQDDDDKTSVLCSWLPGGNYSWGDATSGSFRTADGLGVSHIVCEFSVFRAELGGPDLAENPGCAGDYSALRAGTIALSWDSVVDPASRSAVQFASDYDGHAFSDNGENTSLKGRLRVAPQRGAAAAGEEVEYDVEASWYPDQGGAPYALQVRLPDGAEYVDGSLDPESVLGAPEMAGRTLLAWMRPQADPDGGPPRSWRSRLAIRYRTAGVKQPVVGALGSRLLFDPVTAAPITVSAPPGDSPPGPAAADGPVGATGGPAATLRPISLLSPDQGDVVASGQVLVSWTRVPTADNYVVFVDDIPMPQVTALRAPVTVTAGDHRIRVEARSGSSVSTSETREVAAIEVDAQAQAAVTGQLSASRKRELAMRFRPRFFFDKNEHWRPLDTATFLAEGGHKVCVDRSGAADRCIPADSHNDLFRCAKFDDRFGRDDTECFGGRNAYLDIRGSSVSDYRAVRKSCPGKIVWDCTDTTHSKIHYNVLVGKSLLYADYWLFYRYNQWDASIKNAPDGEFDNHEGDWEGVTAWLLRRRPDRVHTIIYAAHKERTRYLRDTLLPRDFAERGRVYVARGSHASYPRPCTTQCRQAKSGSFGETPYGGEIPWGQNEDSACRSGSCLIGLPAEEVRPGAPARATPDTYSSWNGEWGKGTAAACRVRKVPLVAPIAGCGPGSPGDQARFKTPWAVTQDLTGKSAQASAASARRPASASAGADDAERVLCDDGWFGSGIVATVCDQPAMDAYFDLEVEPAIPTTLALATTAPGSQAGASGGIAQAIADSPLPPLGEVLVAGEASAAAVLSVRAVDLLGVVREAKVRQLALTGEDVLVARANSTGTALTVRRPDGRESVEQLSLPAGYLGVLASHERGRTRMSLSAPVDGTATITLRRGRRTLTKKVAVVAKRPKTATLRLRAGRRSVKPTSARVVFQPSTADRAETVTVRVR